MDNIDIVNATEDEAANKLVDVVRLTNLLDKHNVEVTLSIANFFERKFVEVTLLRTDISPRKIPR